LESMGREKTDINGEEVGERAIEKREAYMNG
jgi:hypothetical protein